MPAAMAPQDPGYAPSRARYLARFPDAAFTFYMADFSLFRIVPSRARYVAGFGRIFDLSVAELESLTNREDKPREAPG
jgi:heme iron utilization protein